MHEEQMALIEHVVDNTKIRNNIKEPAVQDTNNEVNGIRQMGSKLCDSSNTNSEDDSLNNQQSNCNESFSQVDRLQSSDHYSTHLVLPSSSISMPTDSNTNSGDQKCTVECEINKKKTTVVSPVDIHRVLINASYLGRTDVIEVCLKKYKADVNFVDKVGRTGLHYAVTSESIDALKLLLKNNAEVNCADFKGWMPIHIAVSKNSVHVLKILLNNGANVCAKLGHTSAPSRDKKTESQAIHFSAIKGCIETTKLLCEYGASVNDVDEALRSPLHYAAYRNNVSYCKYLIEQGALVNAMDIHRRTPLHAAALSGQLDIAKLLVENGGKVDVRDIWDMYPMRIARIRGHFHLASYLESFGDSSYANICMIPIEETTVQTVVIGLQEPKKDKIVRAVYRLGVERCLKFFEEAIKLHKNGVQTADRSRFRSAGGIFFTLIKDAAEKSLYNLTMDDWKYIHSDDRESIGAKKLKYKQMKYIPMKQNANGRTIKNLELSNSIKTNNNQVTYHNVNNSIMWLKSKMNKSLLLYSQNVTKNSKHCNSVSHCNLTSSILFNYIPYFNNINSSCIFPSLIPRMHTNIEANNFPKWRYRDLGANLCSSNQYAMYNISQLKTNSLLMIRDGSLQGCKYENTGVRRSRILNGVNKSHELSATFKSGEPFTLLKGRTSLLKNRETEYNTVEISKNSVAFSCNKDGDKNKFLIYRDEWKPNCLQYNRIDRNNTYNRRGTLPVSLFSNIGNIGWDDKQDNAQGVSKKKKSQVLIGSALHFNYHPYAKKGFKTA